jgi:hypothetical protein
MIFSRGFKYRWGRRLREAGERAWGVPVLCLFSGLLISLGDAVRNSALSRPACGK